MQKTTKILFINGSPNKEGNTAALADRLLSGKAYETLNLTDYKIYSYGQNFPAENYSFCSRERLRKSGCWKQENIR